MSEPIPTLEHVGPASRAPGRVVIHGLPFRIGRSKQAELTIASREVSSFHCQIVRSGDGYAVEDLDSRNGTFVNGTKVGTHPLEDGAILHVANVELRFVLADVTEAGTVEATFASPDALQQALVREAQDLWRVFEERAVSAVFQPIVRLDAPDVRVAYETLGRAALGGRDYGVGKLFTMAVERGEAAKLSGLMREVALAELPRIPEREIAIFFNLHPAEMERPEHALSVFRRVAGALGPGQRGVVEIHESAVSDLRVMATLARELRGLGISLAYDDFGAGQARLQELLEVPPDYLKLDMGLVRDIDRHPKKRELVGALVKVISGLDVTVLAEGIEREGEAAVCRDLGCVLGQGYFYGRPAPLP